jgi:hypothetical protein
MQTIRDFLGAWLVVGVLGLAVVGIWGFDEPSVTEARAVACDDGASHNTVAGLQGAEVPRNGWHTSPELTGLPRAGDDRLTSYEAAEERNLETLGMAADQTAQLAQGSSTSLNPTSMC